jgi:hypothetical protein
MSRALAVDARRMPDPFRPSPPHLTTTSPPLQAVRKRRFQMRGQSGGQLSSRIEPPPPQPRRRWRHRHDRPAQHMSGSQPLDPLRHQVRHRQQPPELQSPNQVPRHPFIRRRRPDLVQPRRPPPQQRLRIPQPPRASSADHRLRPATAATRSTKRRHQRHPDSRQQLHAQTLPSKPAHVARTKRFLCISSVSRQKLSRYGSNSWIQDSTGRFEFRGSFVAP